MTKTPQQMAEDYAKDNTVARKDQLQPQPFHAGADVYVIDANHPLPKPMPLSIAEQEKPRFEFKPLEYCGDDEVLREMFSLPTNYWMTEQELKECGLQAVVADQLADADKVMNSPKKPDSWNSSNNSNGWISVKERLPELFKVYDFYRDSNCVLITVVKESDQQTPVNPYVTVAHLAQFKSEEPMWTACRCSVSGNEVEPNEWEFERITHWMPLPTPPEE